MKLPTPVRIGLESVKANAVPMVVLWSMAEVLQALFVVICREIGAHK